MTEKELENLFSDSNVIKAATVKPAVPLIGEGEKALALWFVVQIVQWLKNKSGIQYPKVLQVIDFTNDYCNVKLLVGYSGKFEQFFGCVEMISLDGFLLRIFRGREDRPEGCKLEWEKWGVKVEDSTGGSDFYIETLPTGNKKASKNGVLRGF